MEGEIFLERRRVGQEIRVREKEYSRGSCWESHTVVGLGEMKRTAAGDMVALSMLS